jgi:hypothetical protein
MREQRNADFYEPLNISKAYKDLKVEGTQRIGARSAYVVAGQFPGGAPIRFYFDIDSGLLIRKYTVVATVAGNSPYQEDYEDYRDAGSGVKYPYIIRLEPAGPRTEIPTHSTIRIQRIQENITMDSSKFKRPEPKEESKGR